MVNTIETNIGIGIFPVIGIGFKLTLLIGFGIGNFLFWPTGFVKNVNLPLLDLV